MLMSIENAKMRLGKCWWAMAGLNAMAMSAFLFSLFQNRLPIFSILFAMAMCACIGLAVGIYLTFRSRLDSTYGLWYLFYILLTMELMFAGGVAALVTSFIGRSDLRWLAFFTNAFCMALTLWGGIHHEARAIGCWWTNAPNRWQKKIEEYIDYSTYQISPSLTDNIAEKGGAIKSPFWIVAVGSANIPLLFELYGGGRANAIFLAAPVMTGVFAYLNLKYWGRDLVRLLLLRQLEKSKGRRFINADLEQIQELRRGFFMARWLMKDFAPVQVPGAKVR